MDENCTTEETLEIIDCWRELTDKFNLRLLRSSGAMRFVSRCYFSISGAYADDIRSLVDGRKKNIVFTAGQPLSFDAYDCNPEDITGGINLEVDDLYSLWNVDARDILKDRQRRVNHDHLQDR